MTKIGATLALIIAIAINLSGAAAAETARVKHPDQITRAAFMARAEAAFLRIDKNKDGVIDREEMKHAKAGRLDQIMENHKKRDSDRKERKGGKD